MPLKREIILEYLKRNFLCLDFNNMKIKLYHIDAFTDFLFKGNPAAVCILDSWIDENKMQLIAMENNLSETAFVVKEKNIYHIRWFTPISEVDLCGHATLASSFVIFKYLEIENNLITFQSINRGKLTVYKKGSYYTLDFPSDNISNIKFPKLLTNSLNIEPISVFEGKDDFLLIFDNQKEIESLEANYNQINKCGKRGIIVSSPGNKVDFVSRFFDAQVLEEDPVTGSAHTTLIPFWSKKLKKSKLTAKQLSKRGGFLRCEYLGDRVRITGNAIEYMKGEINI